MCKKNVVLIWFNKWEKKQQLQNVICLKFYTVRSAKTFNCQKKMIIMIVVRSIRLRKI